MLIGRSTGYCPVRWRRYFMWLPLSRKQCILSATLHPLVRGWGWLMKLLLRRIAFCNWGSCWLRSWNCICLRLSLLLPGVSTSRSRWRHASLADTRHLSCFRLLFYLHWWRLTDVETGEGVYEGVGGSEEEEDQEHEEKLWVVGESGSSWRYVHHNKLITGSNIIDYQ